MANEEQYPEGYVKLNLIINPETGDMYACGGELNDGPEGADVGFKGFDELQKMVKPAINAIYTITTLHDIYTVRCIGFYFEAKHAIEEVLNNSGDMCECGHYPYCVVEEIKPGIYFYDRVEVWFEWNYEKEMYIKIDEKPELYKHMAGFALG